MPCLKMDILHAFIYAGARETRHALSLQCNMVGHAKPPEFIPIYREGVGGLSKANGIAAFSVGQRPTEKGGTL